MSDYYFGFGQFEFLSFTAVLYDTGINVCPTCVYQKHFTSMGYSTTKGQFLLKCVVQILFTQHWLIQRLKTFLSFSIVRSGPALTSLPSSKSTDSARKHFRRWTSTSTKFWLNGKHRFEIIGRFNVLTRLFTNHPTVFLNGQSPASFCYFLVYSFTKTI